MSKKFENKVAFITGGSTGIGFSTAKRFAEEGAKVVIASSNVERGEAAVKQIKSSGGEATFIQTDVSQFDQIQRAIEKTIEIYGRLDFAFNNAGTPGKMGSLHTGSEQNWDRVLDVNLKGIWAAMKFEIQHMIQNGGGVIINNSSTAGGRGMAGLSVYNASKFGIHGLTKAAALEYAKAGVRVNVVMPGPIETNMIQGMQEYLVPMVPMKRTGDPDDIANAVLWLCSDEASFVTGVALPVDGGMLES
ncbi:MAG: 3-oxoacyl-[acyl-carrier-protein] reductase FabG [Candidatus Heimdallarchaeota archaeon LC_3]|nr:MAG: 3-oxoacyl-[acyl-carrier-protein] reductase FabG [Candidatus Heimdallarchaeota archaeon LC_3]